jgi:hypothetical protein
MTREVGACDPGGEGEKEEERGKTGSERQETE